MKMTIFFHEMVLQDIGVAAKIEIAETGFEALSLLKTSHPLLGPNLS
jgi:hypothetical protein